MMYHRQDYLNIFMDDQNEEVALYWDLPYAIALALMEHHPQLNPVDVGLYELAELIEALPGFRDDPALVTERFLLDIQSEWYEEATTQ
jgi:FeS assembly protein IscX